jgi:23S rRNA pseudouridine2605 synthase
MTEDVPQRSGERIAKVIARAGLASRRDAERMVAELRVKVNGRTVSNVAHNVEPGDAVTVDGTPLPAAEGARLWLYHKPVGLVVTERDEEGRDTVFDALRDDLGRVLSVGRLDLNSEGLLLLTNDGGLKRRLELPATGWLRRYRVRVNGTPDEAGLQRLRDGIEVSDETGEERFAPMQVGLDRQQGANAWLTIGLREGRNREIRRALSALGLYVNRLIRVSYGPFQLGPLAAGAHEEVRPKVLADQLGSLWTGPLAETRRVADAKDAEGRARTKRTPRSPAAKTAGGRDRPKGPTGGRGGAAKPAGGAARGAKPGAPRRTPTASDHVVSGTDDAPRDRRGAGAAAKKTKAERKTELRRDTSVSLRKGGQRGRGHAKPKRGGTPGRPPSKR